MKDKTGLSGLSETVVNNVRSIIDMVKAKTNIVLEPTIDEKMIFLDALLYIGGKQYGLRRALSISQLEYIQPEAVQFMTARVAEEIVNQIIAAQDKFGNT